MSVSLSLLPRLRYSEHLIEVRPAPRCMRGNFMTSDIFLKKDIFGEIRHISCADGDTIVRDTSHARPWCRWLARHLLRREARCLAHLDGIVGVPTLLEVNRNRLARCYVEGSPLQEARPKDPDFFRKARRLLCQLHRAGVAHNDLAKEPNVLVGNRGQPAFVDFQLATISRQRGRWFRLLAYDDLRHLLKHKRTYCPDALTGRERQILAAPSVPSRLWMRTGKPIYLFVTRQLLGWSDREGAGDRDHIG